MFNIIEGNLRNALYYPEKRPFFLEGTDMLDFAANNKDDDRPLTMAINTRNIVAPLLGVKLTGKIGNKDTLSSIFAVDEFPENKADFFILRYKRALRQDSYIGGFLTDKEMSGGYNRIIGTDGRLRLNAAHRLEYHLFSSFSLKSDGGESINGTALGIDYFYFSRKFQFIAGLLNVSKGFRAEIGYLKRAGILSVPVDARYSIYPQSHFFQYAIVRSRNTFQLNKYLFLRGIIEVNAFYKKITADFLASFTYIPGTVIQLGYGSMYEKVFWTEGRTISSDDFQQTNKAFFFKASYMLRL